MWVLRVKLSCSDILPGQDLFLHVIFGSCYKKLHEFKGSAFKLKHTMELTQGTFENQFPGLNSGYMELIYTDVGGVLARFLRGV